MRAYFCVGCNVKECWCRGGCRLHGGWVVGGGGVVVSTDVDVEVTVMSVGGGERGGVGVCVGGVDGAGGGGVDGDDGSGGDCAV